MAGRACSRGLTLLILTCLGLVVAGCNDYSGLGGDVTSALEVRTDSVSVISMRNFSAGRLYTDVFALDRDDGTLTASNVTTLNQHQIGVLNDPVLGSINASGVFQFSPTTRTVPNLGFDVRVDSVLLGLSVDARYGDPTIAQTFEVRELEDTLRFPYNYKPVFAADTTVDVLPTVIGSTTVLLRDTTRDRQIRINLPISIGQRVLSRVNLLRTDSAKAVLAFKDQVFRGLEIRSAGVGAGQRGALYSFSNTGVSIAIYYRSRSSASQVLVSNAIVLGVTNRLVATEVNPVQRYTKIVRTTAGTLLDSVRNPATDANTRVVSQGMTDQVVRVRLNDLRAQLQNTLINSARLTVYLDPQSLSGQSLPFDFNPPLRLNLYVASATDSNRVDWSFDPFNESPNAITPSPVAQGFYNSTLRAYEFDLRSLVQYMIGAEGRQLPLVVVPDNRQTNPRRAILATNKHPNPRLRPKLRVIYSPQPR